MIALNDRVKLILVKAGINVMTLVASKILPWTDSTYPQTRILDRVFARLTKAFETELRAQRRGLEDDNFRRLLDVSFRALAYIGEGDRYYRQWLGLLFLLVEAEVVRARAAMSREELLYFLEKQFQLKGFAVISEAMFQHRKDELFPVVLTDFLHTLA